MNHNDNYLQQDPLSLFDDFMKIPDNAFEYGDDIEEINSLIETIMNSEDFVRVLVDSHESGKSSFDDYDAKFDEWIANANKGEYGNGKKKEMIIDFIGRCRAMFDEIKATNGYFQKVPVKFCKVTPDAILPKYQSIGDAGADIYANDTVTISPNETKVIPSGVKAVIPGGYRISIVPRSGLSLKSGLRVANAPGTIDCTYRNEIGVIIHNNGSYAYTVNKGDRIAQMILERTPKIEFTEIDEEEFAKYSTDRGAGFGSSGK